MAYAGHPGAGGGYYQGGYGSAPGGPAFPGQAQDPLYGYFAAVAGQDGQIDADELQRCLTQSGIAGAYKPFNLETCRLMISMLDRDMSGMLGFNEFKELWAVLNGWRQHFMTVDTDRSGAVDSQELQKALTGMGYRLSPQAVNGIVKRYSSRGKISFDDYIACCVKLRALTDSFRRRIAHRDGKLPVDDLENPREHKGQWHLQFLLPNIQMSQSIVDMKNNSVLKEMGSPEEESHSYMMGLQPFKEF
ncbi:sorcin [Sceloporus undulatus]|uniref:sorcin n=1 Tax=Sceloporus undulatus TaxID=8520 RepID=UPI001C4BF8C9|nr:sorcin [Sceloporus undulatus]